MTDKRRSSDRINGGEEEAEEDNVVWRCGR
jgi:hypothetical protein